MWKSVWVIKGERIRGRSVFPLLSYSLDTLAANIGSGRSQELLVGSKDPRTWALICPPLVYVSRKLDYKPSVWNPRMRYDIGYGWAVS